MNFPFKSKKNGTGFIFVEMLIYIAVLAIIVLAVSSFFLWAVHSNTKAKVMREALDNSRRAMEIITSEIKEAKSIYTPTSIFNVHPGQLSLEGFKYLPLDEIKTYIDFYLCDDHLCLKKESQNPIVLTSEAVKVTNLIFTQIANVPPSIKIDLQIEFKDTTNRPERQASVNTTSIASLRSY